MVEVSDAIGVVESWIAQPSATVVDPTERHASVLRELLAPLGTGGNLTSDAHLAALAIEHGATLCSCDVDFSRFQGLRWIDPLAP
jgi:predicted nucleic acid-binding protein